MTVVVGVDDHRGWANLVSVALEGGEPVVVDRRRVALIGPNLPNQPHHHEAQGIPLAEAKQLIGRVAVSIAESTHAALRALVADVGARGYGVRALAIRGVPKVSGDLGAVLENQNVAIAADTVLYLEGLIAAAAQLGIEVRHYERRDVAASAAALISLRDELGAPWTKEHCVAAAAAIAELKNSGA